MVKGEVSQDEERKHVTCSAHMQKKKKLGTEVKEIILLSAKNENETTTCYLYLPKETVLDRNMALKQPDPLT